MLKCDETNDPRIGRRPVPPDQAGGGPAGRNVEGVCRRAAPHGTGPQAIRQAVQAELEAQEGNSPAGCKLCRPQRTLRDPRRAPVKAIDTNILVYAYDR